MPKPKPRKHEWKDQYTLLCNRCGYIIENLYADSNCPECGHPIEKSLPTNRTGTPWQLHQQSMIALIKTWFMTIGKPSKVINTMKFDQANGKSMAAHTPFVAVILALLALVPMAITEGIGGTIFIILAVGLVGLLYWAMAAIYFRLSVIRLNLAGKKRSYKIDEQMAWSIIGHASSFWILIPASHAVILWIALITSHAEKSHRIDPNSTLNNILGYTVITLFLGSIPTSFVLSELFIFRASRRLRYINHSARPLFSSDTQQLLTKPSPADSPPQKP